MTTQAKLSLIREQMRSNGISAYIIPSADPHMSEYLPDHYKCIEFASGFTGSAGTLVITQDFAGLWTDFRYFVQAAEQLQNSGYELVKLKVQHAPEFIDWLHNTLPGNATVGYNDKLLSVFLGELLKNKLADKSMVFKSHDFLNTVWANRPALPSEPAMLIDKKHTGQSTADKLKQLRLALKNFKADYQLISSLDDIAWLFNIRGKDVSYNPVVLSFALISADKATLFIDQSKLSASQTELLIKEGVSTRNYDEIGAALKSMPENSSVFIDPKRNCYGLYCLFPASVKFIHDINPTTHFKAVKNSTEVENVRSSMVKDGVAMAHFHKWIEDNIGKIRITELSASERLKQFRAEQEGFAGVSFNTIGGYQAHGALPHYAATPETDAEILEEGLFLVDSGGQYFYGTTDITRMIPLGNQHSEEQKTDYTLVLKAMIEGSKTLYPKGTCGYQIDAICRRPLWDHAINYGHGTGHGIGYYLNVHEGPQTLNPANIAIPLEQGMITSIEPGIYRPGKYGIRIENLVLTIASTINEFNEFYAFETLTLAVIDTTLVKTNLLEKGHINWLNQYHQQVFDKLSPHLSADEQAWLKEKCRAI